LIGLSVVLVVGVMLMMANVGDAGDSQKEFGKSRRYDAKQCVMVEEELMIVKKKTKRRNSLLSLMKTSAAGRSRRLRAFK
tara:strand:- start:158 stop:397 length:240 start_codon:yes stop_codon:yes gene_type:complete